MSAAFDDATMSGAEFRQKHGQGKAKEPPPNGKDELAEKLNAAALDLQALANLEPPARRFAWAPWIPAEKVTLLHGDGGTGKSLLSLQIAVAYALGHDLFGGNTESCPALVLAGEDDHDEVWRRLLCICRRFGVRLPDLTGKLDLLAVPHLDITLAQSDDVGAVPAYCHARIASAQDRGAEARARHAGQLGQGVRGL
jgi:AAA domain